LALSDWSGTIPAGGSSEITLTFRAGQREPGEYRSMLVVEDTAGVVLASVRLTMVVTPDTPAEPGPEDAGVTLAVSPNPVTTTGTVALTLPAAALSARVAVYDVLGREVGVVLERPLPAGRHTLDLPAGLPAGVYLVRAVGAGVATVTTFLVIR
jgi:hypothetical protein